MTETATKPVNLQRFCDIYDPREWLRAPWRDGAHIYATNGHWLAQIPDDGRDTIARTDKHPNAALLFEKHVRTTEWRGIPVLPPKESCLRCKGRGVYRLVECEDCEGDGCFEHGQHTYQCKQCKGTGSEGDEHVDTTCEWCCGLGESKRKRVLVDIEGYDVVYLRWLAKLPNIRVAETKVEGPLVFEFDGGRGLLMPMRGGPSAANDRAADGSGGAA